MTNFHLIHYYKSMKREEKKQKENRIACSLRELLIARKNNYYVEDHIEIPVCVLQNLVWNTNITSGKMLINEIINFEHTPEKYKPVHSVSTNVLTSKYIRPALKRINQQVSDEIIKNQPSELSLPYKVELIASKDEKSPSYRFSPYRELYTAQRLYAYFEEQTLNELSLHKVTFHRLFSSDTSSMKSFLSKCRKNKKNPPLSVTKQLEYTSDHVIPVLNLLNQITEEKEKTIKYTLDIIYSASQPTGYQATYVFHRHETPSDTGTSKVDNSTKYYSTKKAKPIYYYKMSKWAYLLHIFLFHIYQQEGFCKAEITYDKTNTKDTIVELDAKKMWDFWYLIPHDDTNPFLTEEEKKKIEEKGNERTNTGKKKTGVASPHTSFYNEFEKAIEEINNLYILKIGAGETKAKIFLLPDLRSRDEIKADKKKSRIKYNTSYETNNGKISTTYQRLYHTSKNPTTGKYLIQINTNLFVFIKKNKCTSTYPKAYAHFFPKASYSQIRLLEYLSEDLPEEMSLLEYLSENLPEDNKKETSLPMLATITGKFDISDYKINKHFANLDLMEKPVAKLFTSYKYHHRFGYLFYEQFIKETITRLNGRFQELGCTTGYETKFSPISSKDPEIPSIEFTLVPIDVAIKQ